MRPNGGNSTTSRSGRASSAGVSSRVLSIAGLAAVLAVAGCTTSTTSGPAPGRPGPAPASPTRQPPTTTEPSAPQPTQNLAADAAVRQELVRAFTAFRANQANTAGFAAIPPSAVAGISPGTLYYAFDPATSTYWASASFSATAAASRTAAFIGFQDGGNSAVFMRLSSRPWVVKSVGPCKAGLPGAVAATWGLTQGPNPLCPDGVPA
jgi:hypothetical protein